MKIGPNADFPVRVRYRSDEVSPETAQLYADVFDVWLNVTVSLTFVPDLSGIAPPWDDRLLPQDIDAVTTVAQARMASVLLETYVVTPNVRFAGTQERFRRFGADAEEPSGVVFYVTPEEFDRHRTGLAALNDITSGTFIGVKVGELRGHDVVTFIERRILDSAWLRSEDAIMLGRPTSSAEG